MPLDCNCDYDSTYDYIYEVYSDYLEFPRERGVRCKSCNEIIQQGKTCTSYNVYVGNLHKKWKWELRWDEQACLAPAWLCESCSDIYLSLIELGYDCLSPEDDMRDMIIDYQNHVKEVKILELTPPDSRGEIPFSDVRCV